MPHCCNGTTTGTCVGRARRRVRTDHRRVSVLLCLCAVWSCVRRESRREVHTGTAVYMYTTWKCRLLRLLEPGES